MTVLTSHDDKGITTITLNRPEKKNAINWEMILELKHALQEIKDNESVRCVVITGNGTAFSAGGDISEMQDRFGKALSSNNRLDTGLNEIVRLIRSIKRPVIAAINGPCYGAGFVIATSCDLLYASSESKFGFAYGNIGLIPEASYFITRLVGLIKAKELVFFRKTISPDEALSYGLINKIIDSKDFISEIDDLSTELSKGPVDTYGLSKELLNSAFENQLLTHLKVEALAQGTAFTSDEHQEGVKAFLEKRKPDFVNIQPK